jgi:hypothetical protein
MTVQEILEQLESLEVVESQIREEFEVDEVNLHGYDQMGFTMVFEDFGGVVAAVSHAEGVCERLTKCRDDIEIGVNVNPDGSYDPEIGEMDGSTSSTIRVEIESEESE